MTARPAESAAKCPRGNCNHRDCRLWRGEYSREDMARAWDRGYAEGAIAAIGLDAQDNPYLPAPSESSDGAS